MKNDSKLSLERLKEVLLYNPDTGKFIWKTQNKKGKARAGTEAAKSTTTYKYCMATIDGEGYKAHRLAWFYVYGAWPEYIDHINGDKKDNRIQNLRSVTNSVNMQNLKVSMKNSKTGLIGASPKGSRFVAVINVDRVKHHIGVYDTAQEAHAAYIKVKRKIHPGCTI